MRNNFPLLVIIVILLLYISNAKIEQRVPVSPEPTPTPVVVPSPKPEPPVEVFPMEGLISPGSDVYKLTAGELVKTNSATNNIYAKCIIIGRTHKDYYIVRVNEPGYISIIYVIETKNITIGKSKNV